jgi:uncharacterized protein YacL (UPF0231 family)
MKKVFIILLGATLFLSCNEIKKSDSAPQQIGYQISDNGEKISLYGGDMAAVSLWETYLKAHNERDLETIAALNADKDFVAYGPKGEVIKGTEAHMEFLTTWFEQTNPTWTTKFLITNMYTDKEGKVQQWITSGHDLTLTVEGEEVKVNQVHDGLIVDGKIKMFTVNERVMVEEQEEKAKE